MADSWAPLWSGITESSIWDESDEVRITFITLLALKDSDHVVRKTAFQIGKRARYDEATTIKALKVLASPDRKRIEPQPHEGRRIQKVEDGWLVLNGEQYRKKVSDEMRKARLRRAQNTYRAKHGTLPGRGQPLTGEAEAAAAYKDGGDAAFDQVTTSHLPKAAK